MKSFIKQIFTTSLFLTLFISCKKESPVIVLSTDTAQSLVIGKPVRIGNLEIAQNDFPYKLDWATAAKSCADLGLGWRLPSSGEFNIISDNLSMIPGIKLNQGGY
jgi:hypothetical protein